MGSQRGGDSSVDIWVLITILLLPGVPTNTRDQGPRRLGSRPGAAVRYHCVMPVSARMIPTPRCVPRRVIDSTGICCLFRSKTHSVR